MPKTHDVRLSKRTYAVRLPEPLEAKVKLQAAALGLKDMDVIRHALAVGLAKEEPTVQNVEAT